MQQNQFPFQYPGMYSPGQMAFNNSPELSQVWSMFAGPLMGGMFGPGTFMPHMMPGQALADQFAMRNYQNQTRTATFNLADNQNADVAKRLLGGRSMFTDSAATDLNKEQARSMANIINNPMTKAFLGMAVGPENLEAMLHGRRGDVTSIGNTVNQMGYFRRDPGGGGRMDAESLEDYASGVFSHLYEPQGDVKKLGMRARAGDSTAASQLQTAAGRQDSTIVSDEDVSDRLQKMDNAQARIDQLYKKYVAGGTATDAATQAKELTKFNRAISESGVLSGNETTVGQLEKRAFDKPTDDMHGFMAGQVSQLMQNLSERGIIGPGIGGMNADDRVKALADTQVDDATLDRLARTAAERAVSDPSHADHDKYRNMTELQREQYLTEQSDTHRDEMKRVQEEARKTARGEAGAMSAEDVMQLGGAEALAGNVDSKRTASTLKEYTGALDAVRDIFGDSGNPNAPMPALLAMLDQLTQGSMGAMKPAQVANTLRQMQTLARETGTGMHQLAAMSNMAGAMGQQLGLAPSITMQNVAHSMGMTKSMMDSGSFSGNVFGSMSKEDAQMRVTEALQKGDASANAKSMAALARIYQQDPTRFGEDSELAAAVRAYNDPNAGGKYMYKGEERDLAKMLGEGGRFAALDLLKRSGGDERDFFSVVNDPRTQYFQKAGFGFLTQKHEMIRDISAMSTSSMVRGAMKDSTLFDGMSEKERRVMQSDIGKELTSMVVDSSDLNPDDQVTFLQNNAQARLEEFFKKKGHADPKKAAAEVVSQMGFTGPDARSAIDRMVGNIGTVSQMHYGYNITQQGQVYGKDRDVKGIQEAGKAAARASAHERLLGAHQSGPMARVSDYFLDIGERGEKFNMDNFLKEMTAVGVDKDIAMQYAGAMGGGLEALSRKRGQVTVTDKYLNDLDKRARGGEKAAQDELRKRAQLGEKDVVVSAADLDKAVEADLADLKGDKLREAYIKHTGSAGTADETQMREELRRNEAFRRESTSTYMAKKKTETGNQHLSEDEVRARASRDLYAALEGKEGQKEDIDKVMAAAFKGGDDAALSAGLEASFRLYKDQASGKEDQIRKLVKSDAKGADDELLKTLGLTREEYEAGKKSATKSDKQEFAEVQMALRDARQMELDKKTGPDGAKQQVQEAKIDANTVVIKADRIEGGGAGGATGTTIGAPGSTVPTDLAGIDAELAAIKEKDDRWTWGASLTPEETKRREELMKKREELASGAAKPETPTPDAPMTPPAGVTGPEGDAGPAGPAGAGADVEDKNAAASPSSRAGITPDAEAAAAGGLPTSADLPEGSQRHTAADTTNLSGEELRTAYAEQFPDGAPDLTEEEMRASLSAKSDPATAQHKKPGAGVEAANAAGSPGSNAGITADAAAAAGDGAKLASLGVSPDKVKIFEEQRGGGLVPERPEGLRSANITPPAQKTDQAGSDGIIPEPRIAPNQLAAGSPGGPGGKDDKMTVIEGTLSVNGMHEAVLRILGQRSIQTPSGGIPVVTDPPQTPVAAAGQRRGAGR